MALVAHQAAVVVVGGVWWYCSGSGGVGLGVEGWHGGCWVRGG